MGSELIQSVDRALELLIYLQLQGEETGITKIASDLNVYKSTVYRTLATLEARGFVQKNPATEKYWLGTRLFTLGKAVENSMGLSAIIQPFARKLHELCGETVNVSILDYTPGELYHTIVIVKEKSPNQVLIVSPKVGSISECHNSSVGKCLLAFAPGVDLSVYKNRELTKYTKSTITSFDELKAELDLVKEKGYAIDCEEKEVGLTCFGVPILDRKGNAVAAISLSGPTSRMMDGDFEGKINTIRRVAAEISRSL